MRLQLALWQRDYGATVDVYAPGTANGGTAGSMSQVGTAVPWIIVPYAEFGQIAPPPPSMSGGRATYIGIDSGTAVAGLGCELRYAGGTYIVEGTADWRPNRVVTLSKVANPYRP